MASIGVVQFNFLMSDITNSPRRRNCFVCFCCIAVLYYFFSKSSYLLYVFFPYCLCVSVLFVAGEMRRGAEDGECWRTPPVIALSGMQVGTGPDTWLPQTFSCARCLALVCTTNGAPPPPTILPLRVRTAIPLAGTHKSIPIH